MSMYVDLSVNSTPKGGLTITREQTSEDGVHTYMVLYGSTTTPSGTFRDVRVRVLHKESDGATVLAAKALGEVMRVLQLGVS